VYGLTTANTGGVHGKNGTSSNEGYIGGPDYGVYGTTGEQNTPGVIGVNTFAGSGWGVQGQNTHKNNNGYLGGATYGVLGTTADSLSLGVYAVCSSYCVALEADATANSSSYAAIVNGQAAVNGNLTINGDLDVTGSTKNFVDPHPSDPTKEIRFVCLEGPESGTYFRGTGRIVGGFAEIEVPESFRLSTSPDNLTVVATPVGGLAVLAAVRVGLDKIVIQGSSDVAFSYLVNGVRQGFEGFRPIVENTHFVPRNAGDHRWDAIHAEAIRRLKATGILNADGSINLETAHRLGWDQRESWKRAEERRTKR
jgi:hypothetical protein